MSLHGKRSIASQHAFGSLDSQSVKEGGRTSSAVCLSSERRRRKTVQEEKLTSATLTARGRAQSNLRILGLHPSVSVSARLLNVLPMPFLVLPSLLIGLGLLTTHTGKVHVDLDDSTVVRAVLRRRRRWRATPSRSVGLDAGREVGNGFMVLSRGKIR
jgi:hypothetical protein